MNCAQPNLKPSFWGLIPPVTHIPVAYRTTNLGDDIQSYAAMELLQCDQFVDRDRMDDWPAEALIPTIGWFGHGKPVPKSTCIFVGIHIQHGSRQDFSERKVVDWMKSCVRGQGFPAMARDLGTRDFLRELGIDAEFGGCVTQTLPRYRGSRKGTAIIDVPIQLKNAYRDTHDRPYLPRLSPSQRVLEGRVQIQKLATFELVHSNRLHVLLPCSALGTRVRFYPDKVGFQPERFKGYDDLVASSTGST